MWRALEARWPVALDDVEPGPATVPPAARATDGPLEVTVDVGATFWLPPAASARVRVTAGDRADVRLHRVVGTTDARLVVEEEAIVTDEPAAVMAIEPPGPGARWMVTATRPTAVVIERAVARAPRLAWEELRRELHAWIERGGELPATPARDGGRLAVRLAAQEAVARALEDRRATVRPALVAWRKAELDRWLTTVRPAADPYLTRRRLLPQGATIDVPGDGRYGVGVGAGAGAGAGRLAVEAVGPGALVIDARLVEPQASIEVAVRRGGVLVARARDPATAGAPVAPAIGRRLRVVVPLTIGRHAYAIETTPGAAVRAEVRIRRPRLRDLLARRTDETAAAREGLRALVTGPAPVAEAVIADALLASTRGESSHGAAPLDAVTADVATYAELITGPPVIDLASAPARVDAVAALMRDPATPAALRTGLALELAERLPDGVDANALARALVEVTPSPPPALLAALAPHLTSAGRDEQIIAAELAWRGAPASPEMRAALLAAHRAGTWRRVTPLAPAGAPPATRWLEPTTDPEENADAALVQLVVGQAHEVTAVPARDDPTRLSVLRIYVATPPDHPGPIAIRVDQRVHHVLALTPLETLDVAVAPGVHLVAVEPVGERTPLHAFVRVAGHARGTPMQVRTLWPIATAGTPPVSFPLPAPRAGPVRIQIRTVSVAPARNDVRGRRVLWLHTDAGTPPRRLVFDARSSDEQSWPLAGADARRSVSAAVTTWLPSSATRVWLVADRDDVVADIAIRHPRARGDAARDGAPPGDTLDALDALDARDATHGSSAPELERIRSLSAALAADPGSARLHLARARSLAELGETALARRDLEAARAAAGGDPHLVSRIRAVEDRLSAQADPLYLTAQPKDSPIVDGVLLGPSLSAVGSAEALASLAPIARAIRADGASAVWSTTRDRPLVTIAPAALALHGRVASMAGDHEASARALVQLGDVWQAKVEALAAIARDLEPSGAARRDALAPLGFGLATELAVLELSAVRRDRATVTRASRWQPIRATEASAGRESLDLEPGALDEPPGMRVKDALVAAPWPDDTHHRLAPGQAAILELTGPRSVGTEVWCRRLWPAAGEDTCRLAIRVDHEPAREHVVRLGQRDAATEIVIGPGRHQVELQLRADDPTVVLAARFLERGNAIPPVQPTRAFLARHDGAVEIVTAGTGALAIELRGYEPPHGEVDVEIEAAGRRRTLTLPIDPRPAPRVRGAAGRAVALTAATTATVTLTDPGVHRVTIRPRAGIVAVRMSVRVAATRLDPPVDTPAPSPRPDDAAPGSPLAWPHAGARLALAAVDATSPAWLTPSLEVVVGKDDLAELDEDLADLDTRVELAARARRRLGPAWLRADLRGRRVGDLAPTLVARAGAEVRHGPSTIDVDGRLAAQTDDGPHRWLASVRGERAIGLGADLRLVPSITGITSRSSSVTVGSGADPLVAGAYRRDHPHQLGVGVGLRWRPLADQLGLVRIEARSNSGGASPSSWIDHVRGELRWRGLIELAPLRGPIAVLSYRPSLRLADEDRARRAWRHDLGADLTWSISTGRSRWTVGLAGDLFLPEGAGVASSARLVVRWELPRGSDLDLGPGELPLSDLALGRRWTAP